MVDKDVAKSSLISMLAKWLILGVVILAFRFLRWGGFIGLIGMAIFAGAFWLNSRLADSDTGDTSDAQGILFLALLVIGAGAYIVGVRRRRRRTKPQLDPVGQSA